MMPLHCLFRESKMIPGEVARHSPSRLPELAKLVTLYIFIQCYINTKVLSLPFLTRYQKYKRFDNFHNRFGQNSYFCPAFRYTLFLIDRECFT